MNKTLFAVGAVAMCCAAPVAAQLNDNFDGEGGGGTTALNYAAFANFDVSDGSVDLLFDPNGFGLGCAGGTGSCVDLDGSTGNGGRLTTKNFYNFNIGDTVILSFDLSGNMRQFPDDGFSAGFIFSSQTDVNNAFFGGGFDLGGPTSSVGILGFAGADTIAADTPFTQYTVTFQAGTAGSLQAYVGTTSADNVGPILDNFALSISRGVPEPSQWLLLILGFGTVGGAMRRKTAAVRYA